MKGLPDSALVGTYKRLHRKPRNKHYATKQETQENLGAGIDAGFRVLAFVLKPIAKAIKG